ncbi:RiPP maturation radical SAM C-methyltransferase [Nocardiopsis chromatogenes]|uniref:RiPP maturation radical SAM C-methyltransferase n=1 Tax=Nocardiopsis chromatogenes TaxID=280239 RepID=UPI000347780C|nr:RiPP maturation radical SAM C-methyltransferase [Nocardiopsis chromatogenes]
MRIALVSMPWQLLDVPSLALGILHGRVRDTRPQDGVTEFHEGLAWAEFLLERSGGGITPFAYTDVAEEGLPHGLGDWVFSGALYGDPDWRRDRLEAYAAEQGIGIGHVLAMRAHADAFVASCTERILAAAPDVVGFTTTFMQNVPSLAVARRIKEARPGVLTVMGGANCDGPMGEALHRNHGFVDFVVRGEGELAFPALLDHIDRGTDPAEVNGVCWRDGPRAVANPQAEAVVPPRSIPAPDFDQWRRALDTSAVRPYVEPKLVLESARGCWWGEKHQCTFCGLNGSYMEFRSKSPDQVWEEVAGLVERHRILDIIMVDNIIDMEYFKRLLPRFAESGWDLRVHYEVKSNLKKSQVELLADAGVLHIQPGIESLGSRALQIMDKGVSGGRNVRLLRDSQTHGLTVSWNYLYGFPGESDADYLDVLGQVSALVHLQPPGGASRIALERFSPYFERPELGMDRRSPSVVYGHVYDLPESELEDLVYLFDTPERGIAGPVEEWLHEAVRYWQAAHPVSRLEIAAEAPEELVLRDRRCGWPARDHRLDGWQALAYRLLDQGRTLKALGAELHARGRPIPGDRLGDWAADLYARGLVFKDGDTYVALATEGGPVRVGAADGALAAEPV